MLSNLYPFRLFTSLNYEITAPKEASLYDYLVKHLEQEEGYCNLTSTLTTVMREMEKSKVKHYRICLIGNETAEWGIVMELKRRGVVIDTADTGGKNPLLVQISYITGGIHHTISEKTITKHFQCDFMLNSKSRQYYRIDKYETV